MARCRPASSMARKTPGRNIYTQKFFEVQDGITETNHRLLAYLLVTSTEWLDGLEPDVRDQFMKIVDEVTDDRQCRRRRHRKPRTARTSSMPAATVRELTPEQRKAWVDTMKPVWAKFEGDIGKDMIDAAVAINNELAARRPVNIRRAMCASGTCVPVTSAGRLQHTFGGISHGCLLALFRDARAHRAVYYLIERRWPQAVTRFEENVLAILLAVITCLLHPGDCPLRLQHRLGRGAWNSTRILFAWLILFGMSYGIKTAYIWASMRRSGILPRRGLPRRRRCSARLTGVLYAAILLSSDWLQFFGAHTKGGAVYLLGAFYKAGIGLDDLRYPVFIQEMLRPAGAGAALDRLSDAAGRSGASRATARCRPGRRSGAASANSSSPAMRPKSLSLKTKTSLKD